LSAKRVERPLSELKKAILALMQPGETVTTAMKRMTQKSSKLRQNNWKKQATCVTVTPADGAAPKTTGAGTATASPVEDFIELVDECISLHGMFHMYSVTYEALQTSLSLFEYYIPQAADNNAADSVPQIFGPFTSQQIAQWKSQNYLTGATAVLMRRYVAPVATKKSSISMFDDDEEGASSDATPAEAPADDNPWIHSDSIDFGEYIPEEKSAVGKVEIDELESESDEEITEDQHLSD
jgi:hypothetical protein